MNINSPYHHSQQKPSKKEWLKLATPDTKVKPEPGKRADARRFETMDELVLASQDLTYHDLDPYVASIASGVNARSVENPNEEFIEILEVKAGSHYEGKLKAELGFHNGPDAPLVVLFPGIYGSTDGGFSKTFKKIALERGMNYAIFANPLSEEMREQNPARHPGNVRKEAEALHQALRNLREMRPEYFNRVSLAGYSYGGLLAANIARVDEGNGGNRIVKGGVLALSPPENIASSMRQLDGLRDKYAGDNGSPTGTAIIYSREVNEHGYADFPNSHLAERGEGTNLTEIKMADSYGSRDSMKDMVVWVDEHFGHNQLPPNWPHYFERRRVLNEMTYEQYSDDWFSKDPWLEKNGLTPDGLSTEYSFTKALTELDETPVYTLVSADDYILSPEDAERFRQADVSDNDLEYVQVMEKGGHVGLLFNPEIQEFLGDYLASTEELKDG